MTNARLRPTWPSVTVIGKRFWIRFATLSWKNSLAEIADHGAAGPGEELDIERAIGP
jgi:hypothetical protein